MDQYEQMAIDLEVAQGERFKKGNRKKIDIFDDPKEVFIFERIKSYRQSSTTYDPLNPR